MKFALNLVVGLSVYTTRLHDKVHDNDDRTMAIHVYYHFTKIIVKYYSVES